MNGSSGDSPLGTPRGGNLGGRILEVCKSWSHVWKSPLIWQGSVRGYFASGPRGTGRATHAQETFNTPPPPSVFFSTIIGQSDTFWYERKWLYLLWKTLGSFTPKKHPHSSIHHSLDMVFLYIIWSWQIHRYALICTSAVVHWGWGAQAGLSGTPFTDNTRQASWLFVFYNRCLLMKEKDIQTKITPAVFRVPKNGGRCDDDRPDRQVTDNRPDCSYNFMAAWTVNIFLSLSTCQENQSFDWWPTISLFVTAIYFLSHTKGCTQLPLEPIVESES